MSGFKINDLTTKTGIVSGDLVIIGDSEDVVSTEYDVKKTSFSNMQTYMQNNLNFAGVNIKYLTSADSPYTIADGDGFTHYMCDTSSGDINITLPTLADNPQVVKEIIHLIDGNNVNVAGEGAETIGGEMTDIDLPKIGNRLKLIGTTLTWGILDEAISCDFKINGYAGYGSSDTKIMRFSTVLKSFGNLFMENHTTGYNGNTEGIEITILKSGNYSFVLSTRMDASQNGGLSLNSSQLTTNITSINPSDRLSIAHTNTAGDNFIVVAEEYFSAGDVVRVHTSGIANTGGTNLSYFTATYQGP